MPAQLSWTLGDNIPLQTSQSWVRTMDIESFLDKSSGSDIAAHLATLVEDERPESVDDVRAFLLVRDNDLYGKHITPRLACRALVQKGPPGVETLLRTMSEAPGAIYPRVIVEALWYASQGRIAPGLLMDMVRMPAGLDRPPSMPTQAAAQEALEYLAIQSSVDEDVFNRLFGFLYGEMTLAPGRGDDQGPALRARVFEVLSEATIKLSKRLLRDFEQLIGEDHSEETYQQFLAANPVLIDPLAAVIIPKQKLGLDVVTDFALRRHDRRYILVEIEKPQDRIFTKSNDFSAEFTHAVGQVLDFQGWVDSNVAYAQKLLPAIASPRGLLIMGRRTAFTAANGEKLHRYCVNSNAIDVLTFDDVLSLARNLYNSLHGHK